MKFLNRIITYTFFLILGAATFSCQTKTEKMNYKIIDFNKMPGEKLVDNYFNALNRYNFNEILNYNKDVFFLLGDDSEENVDDYNAVIYSTKNMGNSWKKNILGKGTVKEGICIGDKTYIIVDNDKAPFSKSHNSTLYVSNNFGDTWEQVTNINEGGISGINFYSEKIGVAIFSKKTEQEEDFDYEYRYTKDAGKTWTPLDLDTSTACIMNSENSLLYLEKNSVMEYNFQKKEKKILDKISVPNKMEIESLDKDSKTGSIYVTLVGEEYDDKRSALYYIDKKELINLPDNHYVKTYGDFYFTELHNTPSPYSSYAWSSDRGKTWRTEKFENFFPDPRPIGYAEDGYVYMLVAMFKGNEEERGARLVIGHPKSK